MLRELLDSQAAQSYGRTKAQLLLLAGYNRERSKISVCPTEDGERVEVCTFSPDGSLWFTFNSDEVPILAAYAEEDR